MGLLGKPTILGNPQKKRYLRKLKIRSLLQKVNNHPTSPAQILDLPSRELTYPTLRKGKSSSKCHFGGIC